MVDFKKARRGLSAIEEAGNRSDGQGFKPFAPHIQWRENEEEKFILVLTSIDDTLTFDIHEWIPVGVGEKANGETYKKYESFISRKDPIIGESSDHLSDKFGATTRRRTIGAAVELEPIMETVRGRNRPKEFSVKTDSYTRQEEGEVTYPVIGLISQSPINFWGWLGSYDNTQAPIKETPMKVVRRGTGTDTHYDFFALQDTPVNLSNLAKYIDGVSYLDKLNDLDSITDPFEMASVVGNALIEKRVLELADRARYEELVLPITDYQPRFGGSKTADVPQKVETVEEEPAVAKSGDRMDQFARLRAKVENA